MIFMSNSALYKRCYISGHGEVINPTGINLKVNVLDLSAVDAYVTIDGKVDENKLYDINLVFSSNGMDHSISFKGIIKNHSSDKHHDGYLIEYTDISEEKKIEIDEILLHSCIIKETSAINKCNSGSCVLNIKR